MAIKNYYRVLGVPPSETATGIRAAFRELAKRHHPDRVGSEATDALREILEAYGVLSDPTERQRYKHVLSEAEPWDSRPVRIHRRAPTDFAEPLSPKSVEAESILAHPENVHPSFDALHQRLLRNFTGLGIPKGESLQALNIEVVLSAEEAVTGGQLPVVIPIFRRCAVCAGSGHQWLFACSYCAGEGTVEGRQTIWLDIPPFTTNRAVIDVPLEGIEIRNLVLRLHVFVDA